MNNTWKAISNHIKRTATNHHQTNITRDDHILIIREAKETETPQHITIWINGTNLVYAHGQKPEKTHGFGHCDLNDPRAFTQTLWNIRAIIKKLQH